MLLYINKTYEEGAFQKDLKDLAQKNKWLRVVQVLTKEKRAECYEGRLTADILKKEVKNIKGSTYFVVGPPPMMDATIMLLKSLGVSKSKIFSERFALR